MPDGVSPYCHDLFFMLIKLFEFEFELSSNVT